VKITGMAMAALAAVTAAALAGPAAVAQASGDGQDAKQIKYGDDVYGGTEGADATYGSGSSSGTGSGSGATGAWTKFITRLTGPVEVPKGDPDGSGTASIKVRGDEVCYDVTWKGIDAIASHIHKAAPGAAGGIVVPFFASETPLSGSKKTGCTTADAGVVSAIMQHPGNYYVNVHSPQFPKGAIRGQLARVEDGSLPYTGGSRSKGLLLLGLCVIGAGSLLLGMGQRRRSAPAPRH
jgi:LPXTG-motif cell wall-anchored protein